MNIVQQKTPNYSKGRAGYQPIVIVCHIMQGHFLGNRGWFASPKSGVSAHFAVSKKGEIDQYVSIYDRARHVGSVRMPLIKLPYPESVAPNNYTIGIEFEGFSGEPMPEEQYQAGLGLIQYLLKEMPDAGLSIREQVIGHFQINSVERPSCPGLSFPWERLYSDLVPVIQGPAVVFEGKAYPAQIIEGKTWTPVRTVAEAAGLRVDYDGMTQVTTLRR